MIYYLRFDTELQAKEVLSEFVQNGDWIIASQTHSLDPIGPLLLDEVMNDIDGRFHINLQGFVTAYVTPFQVFPKNPRRVWA